MIRFKTKVYQIYNADKTDSREAINVPVFGKKHCDMAFFRSHKKYGAFANSDMFPSMLRRLRATMLPNQYSNHVYLDDLPEGWTIDTSGFLVNVTINVT